MASILFDAFNLAPEEAVEFFRSKGYEITFDWKELWQEAHAKAFTVAGCMRLDILKDIRDALDKAISEGKTFQEFKNELEPILRAKGWWGYDATAGKWMGTPWRLRTIFNTNIQSAYQAGRYKSLQRVKKRRPYWQYLAVLDQKTRPSHAALHGKIFHADDPFWDHFYPPNGYNCRCHVRSLSKRQLERYGLEDKIESSEGKLKKKTVPLSKKYGSSVEVADYEGINPDPGWSYNVGKGWHTWDPNGHLPGCLDLDLNQKGKCIKIVPGQKSWKDYGRPDLRTIEDKLKLPFPGLLKEGKNETEALEILSSELGVTSSEKIRWVKTPIGNVVIHYDLLQHIIRDRNNKRERFSKLIIPTLERPYEIWLCAYEDGLRLHYLTLFSGKNIQGLSIVRINRDQSLYWNFIPMKIGKLNKRRLGYLVYFREESE